MGARARSCGLGQPLQVAKVARFRSEEHRLRYADAYRRSLATATVPVETEQIETPFGLTHVISAGARGRPSLVALHGKALSSTMWLPHLETLAMSHRVHLVDVVGDMNMSESTRVVSSQDEVVEWLDAVRHGLGIDHADLIGHSYGAWLATTYAMARPSTVDHLALLAPAAVF